MNFYVHPCGYYHVLTSPLICQEERSTGTNQTNATGRLTQDLIEKNLLDETTIMTDENRRNSNLVLSSNQSLLNLTSDFSNEMDNQSMVDRTNEQISLTEISNETTSIPEPSLSVNTTDETSSQPNTSESSSEEMNITEPATDISSSDETNTSITATTTPSALNHEVIPPLLASPWLKGMLVNTKSLPELFKIIEKLNFNLTLSNRYLQELSQHYV